MLDKDQKGNFTEGQTRQEVGSRVRTNNLGMFIEEGAPRLVSPTIHSEGSRDPER